MTDASFFAQTSLGRRWHSTTFRLITIYAVIFSSSVMALLGFIGWTVTGQMERETDIVMKWQTIYFDSMPGNALAAAINRRLEHERMHEDYYGLFAPDGTRIAGDVAALPPGIPLDRSGVTLHHTLQVGGGVPLPVVRVMAQQRADGDTLVLGRDLTHILRIRDTIIKALIFGGMLCLTAGVLGGLALSIRQMSRLKAIRRVTARIADGDLGQRLPVGGRDEIDMLAHLVNHMLEEVERLMNEVKGACDGIAHDLRTPLAHVRTLLGHIAERADALGDRQLCASVERARADTDALLDRFRAMLRISEIGALQRRGGFAEVSLRALIEEVGELYEPLAELHAIRFDVHTEAVAAIHGDRALLFEAFSNLVDNAVKFTPRGGAVRIALLRTPDGPVVEITDTGPGIPERERDAVLQRFYRGEHTRHLAGSGLGLSIVSAVMRVHDFALHIGSADPGTRVTIECWSRTLA